MDMAISFSIIFVVSLFYISPVLLALLLTIAAIGLYIGRNEKWSVADSLYYAFITATTVGYGDFRPTRGKAKIAAILIAFIGVLCTGIIVAIGFSSLEAAFHKHHDIQEISQQLENLLRR